MSLVDDWRALLASEGSLPELEFERREEELRQASWEALRRGGSERVTLIQAFRDTDDEDLRWCLEGVILPPCVRAAVEPDEYRSHPEVRFDANQMPIKVALGLPVAADLADMPGFKASPLAWTTSWFGGSPATPDGGSWRRPVRSDGTQLIHVVQVDLAQESTNQDSALFGSTGLPDDGMIQFFHDGETDGWEPDADATAWHVRWIPATDPENLSVIVADSIGHRLPLRPINAQTTATVPAFLDRGTEDERERYQRAADWLEHAPLMQNAMAGEKSEPLTPWDQNYEAPQSVSRMGGFGYAERSAEVERLLSKVLPLVAGDAHVTLFDINPLSIGEPHRFHGGRHVEVWARQSDVRARRFEKVWAIIRTDA